MLGSITLAVNTDFPEKVMSLPFDFPLAPNLRLRFAVICGVVSAPDAHISATISATSRGHKVSPGSANFRSLS